jgi:hypothetical protein
MSTATIFVVTALVVYAFTFGVTRFVLSTKDFKKQPLEDQERARKNLRLAFLISPIILIGYYILLLSPPEVVRMILLLLYVAMAGFACWVLWRSYRLGIRRDERVVKALHGKSLPNAQSIVTQFAIANLFLAIGIIALLVAIPILHIDLGSWGAIFGAITSIYGLFVSNQERNIKNQP